LGRGKIVLVYKQLVPAQKEIVYDRQQLVEAHKEIVIAAKQFFIEVFSIRIAVFKPKTQDLML
jgi:hypothetical protein